MAAVVLRKVAGGLGIADDIVNARLVYNFGAA
mgnify:CR=1 FL=1